MIHLQAGVLHSKAVQFVSEFSPVTKFPLTLILKNADQAHEF